MHSPFYVCVLCVGFMSITSFRLPPVEEYIYRESTSVELLTLEHPPSYRQRRSGDCTPNHIVVRFTADNNEVKLSLQRNYDINVNAPLFVNINGTITQESLDNSENVAAYQDLESGSAILVHCMPNTREFELFGTFYNGSEELMIEPELKEGQDVFPATSLYDVQSQDAKSKKEHVSQDQDLKEKFTISQHVIYKGKTMMPKESEFILKGGLHPQHRAFTGHSARNKRATTAYQVELLMVADYSVYSFWLTKSSSSAAAKVLLRQFYAFVLNGIDLRYKSVTGSGFTIAVLFAGLYIAETPSDALWTESRKVASGSLYQINASAALIDFRTWIRSRPNLPGHDHAMLFTAYDLEHNGNNTTGLVYTKGVCTTYSQSIVEGRFDASLMISAVNVLGYGLGALPDGTQDGTGNLCSPNLTYIMASPLTLSHVGTSGFQYNKNLWKFSPCSISYFQKYINTLNSTNCLTTLSVGYNSTALSPYDQQNPGQIYSADTQCRYKEGNDSYLCRSNYRGNYTNVCTAFYCHISGSSLCSLSIPAERTTCGDRKWCVAGECVTATEAPSVNDTCPFGDQPGIVANGQTCTQLVADSFFNCFNYTKICCESCQNVNNGTIAPTTTETAASITTRTSPSSKATDTTAAPAPSSSTAATFPSSTTATPTPTTTTAAPIPSSTTAAPIPSSTTATPTPTTTTAAPIPSSTTSAPTPTTTTAAPSPSLTTAVPIPTTTTAAPTPSLITAAPTPNLSTAAPTPSSTTAAPAPSSTTAASIPSSTTAAPTPTTTTAALTPSLTTAAPIPTTTTAAPTPSLTTASPTPTLATAAPTPSSTTAAPIPSSTTSAPTPTTTTAAPSPSLTTAVPIPTTTTAAPTPSLITAAPTPNLTTAAPTPSSTTAAPAPSSTTAASIPSSTTAAPTPTTTTAAPTPSLTTAAPIPTTTTAAPTPSLTTASPTPTLTTAAPTPSSTTAAPTPSSTTAAPIPSSTTATPTPTTTTAAPIPSSTTSAPTPTTTTAAPSPSLTTAVPIPTTTTAAPTPSLITAAPTPNLTTAAPTPSSTTAAPAPSSTTAASIPSSTTAAPTPTTTTAALTPSLTTAAPIPTTTTAAPTPSLTTASPTPTLTTAAPTPSSTTAAPTPSSTTAASIPSSTTAAPTPTTTAAPSPSSRPKTTTTDIVPVTVGVPVGGFFFVFGVVALICYLKRRSKRDKKMLEPSSNSRSEIELQSLRPIHFSEGNPRDESSNGQYSNASTHAHKWCPGHAHSNKAFDGGSGEMNL